jgi:hypothetical protein
MPAAHPLFQLVRRRYDRGNILINSIRVAGDWETVLGDQVVATAIVNRRPHHSHVLTIRDDSYQLRKAARGCGRRHPQSPRHHSRKGGFLMSFDSLPPRRPFCPA